MSLTQRNGLKSLYFEPCKYHIIGIDIVSFSSFTLLQQKRYLAYLYEQLQLLCVSPALLRARISEKSITRILVCLCDKRPLHSARERLTNQVQQFTETVPCLRSSQQ